MSFSDQFLQHYLRIYQETRLKEVNDYTVCHLADRHLPLGRRPKFICCIRCDLGQSGCFTRAVWQWLTHGNSHDTKGMEHGMIGGWLM